MEILSSFEQLARRISRERHLQKNSKDSQLVVLVVTIKMLTEISVLFISERGNKHSVMLRVGLAAVLMQPVWAPAVNCATCTLRTIAGTT